MKHNLAPDVTGTKRDRKMRGRELAMGRKQVRQIKYRETDLSALGVRSDR